jgi:hypothetical protein
MLSAARVYALALAAAAPATGSLRRSASNIGSAKNSGSTAAWSSNSDSVTASAADAGSIAASTSANALRAARTAASISVEQLHLAGLAHPDRLFGLEHGQFVREIDVLFLIESQSGQAIAARFHVIVDALDDAEGLLLHVSMHVMLRIGLHLEL